MDKIVGGLIFIGVMLTSPIWIIFVIVILFSLPKDFNDRLSEYEEAMME